MYKKILTTIILSGFSLVNAQEVSDYKYFQITPNTTDFENDKYKLENRLKFYLERKNYVYVSNDQTTWPTELNNDNCAIAKAEIKKLKGFTTNKLAIEFKDCRNQIIGQFEGSSRIKEYEKGYPDALLTALKSVKLSTPTIQPAEGKATPVTVKEVKTPETKIVAEVKAQTYTDGQTEVKISKLENGSFIIINGATIVAQFNPSSREGMYRVTVMKPNGESYPSTGYTTEKSIHFDVQNEQNQWSEKVYQIK